MTPISIQDVLKTIDEWLKSDDVFIRSGQGGTIIPNAEVDCVKGSLIKRLCAISPGESPVEAAAKEIKLVELAEPPGAETMKWIKASERMPDMNGKAMWRYADSKKRATKSDTYILTDKKNHHLYEWLDESPVEAAAKEVEQYYSQFGEAGKAAIAKYGNDPHSFGGQREGFIDGYNHAQSEQGQEEWETAYNKYVKDTWDDVMADSSLTFIKYAEKHYTLIKKQP